jgi:hypothetical protein
MTGIQHPSQYDALTNVLEENDSIGSLIFPVYNSSMQLDNP